jgi:hypothetical protein
MDERRVTTERGVVLLCCSDIWETNFGSIGQLERDGGKGKDVGRGETGRERDDPWNALKLPNEGPVKKGRIEKEVSLSFWSMKR